MSGWLTTVIAALGGAQRAAPVAEVAPAPALPADVMGSPSPDEPSRTIGDIKDSRDVLKWTAGALAATAVAVFGAGPVINKPSLDWSDGGQRTQLIWALFAGAAGLTALVTLILLIGRLLQPQRMTLTTLPHSLLESIEQEPASYLPIEVCPTSDGDQSIAAIMTKFRAETVNNKRMVAGLKTSLARAERQVILSTPDAKALAQQHRDAIAEFVRIAEYNDNYYQLRADNLLDEARLASIERSSSSTRWSMFALAFVAAAGGIGLQLALSTPTASKAASSDATAAGQVAYLPSQPSNSAGAQLISALGIAGCATDMASGIPLTVQSGIGTTASPWIVTTIRTSTECPIIQFSLVQDVAQISLPQPVRVAVSYAPIH